VAADEEPVMIDMSRRYTTRDNKPVRILCVDRKAVGYQICGLITDQDGREVLASWSPDGSYFNLTDEHVNDLVEVVA
jgi:hypothetical protein